MTFHSARPSATGAAAATIVILLLTLAAEGVSPSPEPNRGHGTITASPAFNAYSSLLRRQAAASASMQSAGAVGSSTSSSLLRPGLPEPPSFLQMHSSAAPEAAKEPAPAAGEAANPAGGGEPAGGAGAVEGGGAQGGEAGGSTGATQEQEGKGAQEGGEEGPEFPKVDHKSPNIIGGARGKFKAGGTEGISSCQDHENSEDCEGADDCMWIKPMRRCFKDCSTVEDADECGKMPECYFSRTVPENQCTNDCFQGSPRNKYQLMGCQWCTKKAACDMFGGSCNWWDTEETVSPTCINDALGQTITSDLIHRVEIIVTAANQIEGG
eukprot:GHVU01188188.1.p1 GENE.GHVU01188188.1~~GHVU01188188.1.p1  ORF type:complete len:325 (+),score=61.94 GHVU01188188.1:941-1915(+)